MFLIFIPHPDSKNLGKLIFFSSLAHVENIQNLDMEKNTDKVLKKNPINKNKSFIRFKITWKESDIYLGEITSYDNTLIAEIEKFIIFHKIFQEKKKFLLNSTELFSEDYTKFISPDMVKSLDESKLIEMAMYHESNFMKLFGNGLENIETQNILKEQSKEIIFLYQKIVELMSIRNNDNLVAYMSKLQNFIEITKNFLQDIKEQNFSLLDTTFG